MIRLVRLDLSREGIGQFDYAPLTTAANLRAGNADHSPQYLPKIPFLISKDNLCAALVRFKSLLLYQLSYRGIRLFCNGFTLSRHPFQGVLTTAIDNA